MRRSLIVLLAGLVIYPISPSLGLADVVELKNGQRVEGALKSATPASISVEVGGQTITFEGDKVRAIYFGAAPAPPAPATSLRGDAIRALKGVHSATTGGITYRDYGPRVTDAKIVVDRYLGEDTADAPPLREAIGAAMRYYTLAGNAWSASISRAADYGFVADPAVRQCHAAAKVIDEGRTGRRSALPQATLDGISLAVSFQVLWSCAADKLAEAEKLLSGKVSIPVERPHGTDGTASAGPPSAAPQVTATPDRQRVLGPFDSPPPSASPSGAPEWCRGASQEYRGGACITRSP